MKSIFTSLAIFFACNMGHAAVQTWNIFFVPIEKAEYQLGSGKIATIEINIGYFNKMAAEKASEDSSKLKSIVSAALKESNLDTSTKKGRLALAAQVASKLQEAGFKEVQTVFWNSFTN